MVGDTRGVRRKQMMNYNEHDRDNNNQTQQLSISCDRRKKLDDLQSKNTLHFVDSIRI